MRRGAAALGLLFAALAAPAGAGEADVLFVRAIRDGDAWRVEVTVRHADAGWQHYADWWRVLAPDGRELGRRVLLHPHETEQPFTRDERIRIPPDVTAVTVEAHDTLHGIGGKRVRVDLRQPKGPAFEVVR